jgi:hypothetical protein
MSAPRHPRSGLADWARPLRDGVGRHRHDAYAEQYPSVVGRGGAALIYELISYEGFEAPLQDVPCSGRRFL